MKSVSDYSAEIESRLRKIELPEGKFDNLYQPIRYALSAGGKRIRPVLTLMAAEAFGDDSEKAMNAAIGIEIFHNFTLLHDDVMDKSDMRRGRETVHKKYDSNTAILSGDTMLTLATMFIGLTEDYNLMRMLLNTFNDMALRVYEGQRLDMDFENAEQIALDDYVDMVKRKTGALLGTAAKIGALIGGADEADAEKMYEFGVMTGVAFQIQDDWLDTFGDPTTFGKTPGGDIKNGKKTYLYVAAMEKGGQDTEALKSAFAISSPDMRVKTVTRLYEKLGIGELSKKAVGHYSSLALKALNSTKLKEDKKESFRKLAEKLIGRKK